MIAAEPKLFSMVIPAGAEPLSSIFPTGWSIPPTEPAGRTNPCEMTVSPVPNAAVGVSCGFPDTDFVAGEARSCPESPS